MFKPGFRFYGFIFTVIIFLIIFIFSERNYMLVKVREKSMLPTLRDGQWVLAEKKPDKVKPGDIAIFISPADSRLAVKRCISSGEFPLNIDHGWIITPWGRWYVNGDQWERIERQGTPGKDNFFMVGDNQFNSLDSRSYGFIKKENIIGRVIAGNRHAPEQ